MKLPVCILFLSALILSSCGSFRPTSTVRNPSRTSGTSTRTADTRPERRVPTQKPERRTRKTDDQRVAPLIAGPTAAVRNRLVVNAEEHLGIRYKYGGNTPREGFDCSGFVKYLYDDQGISIHRVSRDQARQGTKIDPDEAKPGDLVFFRRGANQPVFHVSMIVAAAPGELWVIHPTSSRGVIRENILASSYWRPKLYAVKDMIR